MLIALVLSSLGPLVPAPQEPPAPGVFERAVEHCRAGEDDAALAALGEALEAEAAACQRALLEPAFAEHGGDTGLRDLPAFRTALSAAVVAHGVSTLTLAPSDEPGEWIAVDGRVVDRAGAPVAGARVRLFATDARGRYHPQLEGERVPRLFGAVVSDDDGRFHFRTVRPGPYPGTRNARHVHLSVSKGEHRLAAPGYVVFDDDPLLAEPQNEEQRGEALRIRMRPRSATESGTVEQPRRGTLELPMR